MGVPACLRRLLKWRKAGDSADETSTAADNSSEASSNLSKTSSNSSKASAIKSKATAFKSKAAAFKSKAAAFKSKAAAIKLKRKRDECAEETPKMPGKGPAPDALDKLESCSEKLGPPMALRGHDDSGCVQMWFPHGKLGGSNRKKKD